MSSSLKLFEAAVELLQLLLDDVAKSANFLWDGCGINGWGSIGFRRYHSQ
mgnify:CR=1 FL=1